MKTLNSVWTRVTVGVLGILALVALAVYAFSPMGVEALVATDVVGEPTYQVRGFGWQGPGGQGNPGDMLSALPSGELSEEEAQSLLYIREEEKLARDVYMTLAEQWNVQIFQNIARSEQRHMDAVKALLDRYGLEDPAEGNEVGQFTNPDLQALYDQLVAQGSQSLADALKVGGAIEEIDILDLEERISQTDNVDIQTVYENLMRGSRNHLRAFTSTLQSVTGETYEPQYLSADAYSAIVNSEMERGHGYSAGNGGHGQGHGHGRGSGRGGRYGRP